VPLVDSLRPIRAILSSAVYRLALLEKFVSRFVPLPRGHKWYSGPEEVWFAGSTGKKFYLSSVDRLEMYRRGLDYRLDLLLEQYGLREKLDRVGMTIVDVGANIGEIGLAAERVGLSTYIAFEPDPLAYRALERNLPGGILRQIALSDYVGSAEFYLKAETADSSLVPPTSPGASRILTEVSTLDREIERLGIERIDILKIEAEGSEPEVLIGGKQTLSKVDVVAIDAGPERFGASTAPECIEIMRECGFKLSEVRFPRGVLLFERSR
jgi:FkbM family methyltransferase